YSPWTSPVKDSVVAASPSSSCCGLVAVCCGLVAVRRPGSLFAGNQQEVSNKSAGPMPFRLRTFGGLSLTTESGPVTGLATQRRKLALLAVLATGGERGVSRDRLLALFWPESDTEHARHALTQSLFALRRELNAEDLVLGQADLRLNSQVIESDVAAFEVALARGEPAQAAALYAGPFLDGIHLDHQH